MYVLKNQEVNTKLCILKNKIGNWTKQKQKKRVCECRVEIETLLKLSKRIANILLVWINLIKYYIYNLTSYQAECLLHKYYAPRVAIYQPVLDLCKPEVSPRIETRWHISWV